MSAELTARIQAAIQEAITAIENAPAKPTLERQQWASGYDDGLRVMGTVVLAALSAPQTGAVTAGQAGDLRSAAKEFHNLTIGDAEVTIRTPSAEKRDAIAAAGNRLRLLLLATQPHQSPPPQVEPAGWVRVPVELTEAMQLAGALAHQRSVCHDFIGPIDDAWRAMLAAAPKEPNP